MNIVPNEVRETSRVKWANMVNVLLQDKTVECSRPYSSAHKSVSYHLERRGLAGKYRVRTRNSDTPGHCYLWLEKRGTE